MAQQEVILYTHPRVFESRTSGEIILLSEQATDTWPARTMADQVSVRSLSGTRDDNVDQYRRLLPGSITRSQR